MKNRACAAVAWLCLGVAPASQAQLFSYEIVSMNAEDLGTFGGTNSEILDVNHVGDMVGWAEYPNGRRHALLMRVTANAIEDFTVGMDDVHTTANGINDNREVVGFHEYTPGTGHAQAFYRMDGQPLKNLQPFFDYSIAYAINSMGYIVGVKSGPLPYNPGSPCAGFMPIQWYAPANWHQALWCSTSQTPTRATDISNLNLIVGWTNPGSPFPQYGWTWKDDLFTLVPQPATPACGMRALGVNNAGLVVGFASLCAGGVRAFTWNGTDTNVKLLGVLGGGNASIARELNEQNFIVGVSDQLVGGGGFNLGVRNRGFIYHSHFGMKGLPVPQGYNNISTNCEANALGARQVDGGLIRIGGSCSVGATRHAVRWNVVVAKGPPHINPP